MFSSLKSTQFVTARVVRQLSTTPRPTKLGIIGVPFAKGQAKQGVDTAPQVLRQNGLIQELESVSHGNLLVKDYGDLEYSPDPKPTDPNAVRTFKNMKNYDEFMGCNKALVRKVQQVLSENDQFLTVGGDHAIGFGSVAGHLQHTPNLSLVWVDAHADINLHSTSWSGNIHGMPVSFLLKELRAFWEHARLNDFAPNCLPSDQLVYIGLRDIDPYESYILHKLGIRAYAMDSVDRLGIAKIIERTLDALSPSNRIHVSFDIDALDSTVAPSTGTAVPAGLTLREGISIVEALRDTNRVQGIDLVEVNPHLGTPQDVSQTVAAAMQILKSLCGGQKRGGNFDHLDPRGLDIN